MIVALVALGAAVGAPARYLADRAMARRQRTGFPRATFTVNVVASFLLGLVIGAAGHVSPGMQALIGTGFCGALSTFSTFSYEVLRLWEDRRRALAASYVIVSVATGIVIGAAGWALGAAAT